MSKFGTKSVLFGYFWPRILKTYCLFEIRISTFKFVYLQNFAKKLQCLNLESKVLYLYISGLEF